MSKSRTTGRAALIGTILMLGLAVLWSRTPAYLDVGREAVVRLQLVPIPEGPHSRPFSLHSQPGSLPLSLVQDQIPPRLPRPLAQGFSCRFGGNVEVGLEDGRTLRYGPCRRPAEIERLRQAMLRAFDEHG